MEYLIQKDIDTIIIGYLFWNSGCKRSHSMLNHLLICFSERKMFCVLSLNEYFRRNKVDFSSLKKGCIQHIYKNLVEGKDIILNSTKPGTRKKYYPVFSAFGYKVILSNVEKRSKNYGRRGYIYPDNTDMIGEIPRCKIMKRKADFWENWESTGKKADCGCETFTALKFMVGSKWDGITHCIADLKAVKVCSSEKQNEFLATWKTK